MAERGTYRRVAQVVRERIASGELRPGSMLPSELALAQEFSIARGTARAALALLEREGMAEVLPGVGRRVAGKAPSTAEPMTAYETIANTIRADIGAGAYAPESQLPSEAELMEVFGVSRNTVRRAYAVLVDEGHVIVRHGAGAFVAPSGKSG